MKDIRTSALGKIAATLAAPWVRSSDVQLPLAAAIADLYASVPLAGIVQK